MNQVDSRPYDGSNRARQAGETRRRIALAAVEQFAQHGYSATTMAAVAARVGVSTQTVYNGFGTKVALFKRGYDLTLAGDGGDRPLIERPDVAALHADPDPAAFLRGYAKLGRELLERVGPLLLQISAGAVAGEPDLVALRQSTTQERLAATLMVAERVSSLGALAPDLSLESARDRIWALTSAELWQLLTAGRGWAGNEYERWVGQAMCDAVLA